MSHTKRPRPARTALTIPLLLLPLALSAVEYLWTGAVSSDFTDAANWLVASGGSWAVTATPPANTYGVDTVVFDGDAATCPNMPVLDTEYFLRKIEFRTSGWTISGEGRICLNHRFGGNDYHVDGVQHGNINGPSLVDSSESGRNEIACAFRVAFGYEIDVAAGGTLAITGLTTCDNGPGNNLGSAQKHSLKVGDGTLLLGGVGSTGKFTEKYMEVTAGTLQLGRTSDGTAGVAALQGVLRVRGTGKVVYLADNQVTDDKANYWTLGGNGTIDFNGHAQALGKIACGVAVGDVTVGGDWTGEILNSANLRVGTGNSGSSTWGNFLVTKEISQPVVLETGMDTHCGRYNGTGGNALWYYIADNPDLDAELIIQGAVFPGRTGNLGVPVHFTGSTPSDGSHGAVLLECENGSGGEWARVFIETTVYVNTNANETSSLGEPRELTVTDTGVLRGNGVVKIQTKGGTPVFNIYGSLAPGSTNNVGTLQLTRTATNRALTTTMHTNSVFRVAVGEAGALPSVNQDTGMFVLSAATAATTDPDTGDEIPAAPGVTLRITGDRPPAEGVTHRLLTASTLTGRFDEVVVDFPGAKGYHYEVLYGTNYVDFRCSKIGTIVLFR